MIRHRSITAAGTVLTWLSLGAYCVNAWRLGDALVEKAVPLLDRTYEPPGRTATSLRSSG